MTFLAVILLIAIFSCNVNGELNEIPRLSFPKFTDNGDVEWSATPRIIGGYPAVEGEFRGKISIQQAAFYPDRVSHFCGGVLINPSHVLTAAHCVTTENGSVRNPSFYVLVGDVLNLSVITSLRQSRSATHVFVHPRYNMDYVSNDIAIIRTNLPFIESFTFSPVNRVLHTPEPGFSCSVAGWGATVYEGPISPRLQRINATIIDRSVCNGIDSYNGLVLEGMICAGTMAGGVDTCQGDSGGGLICGNDIAGIVSWGIGCAVPLKPGVYTEVAVFNDWIEETILFDGEHASIPTPTTVLTTEAPGSAASLLVSINLLAVCLLKAIIVFF